MSHATRRIISTYTFDQIADYIRDFEDLELQRQDGLLTLHGYDSAITRLRRAYSTRCKPHLRRVNGFYEVRVHAGTGAPLHSFDGQCPAVFDTFSDACDFASLVMDAIVN